MNKEELKDTPVCLENFDKLYKHYNNDLRLAVFKWMAKVPKNSDMVGMFRDPDEIRSLVDEIFLECVKSWSSQKAKTCKFRSYLITQLNRRLLNHLKKCFKKHRAIPPNKIFPLSDILNNKLNYPDVYSNWDIVDINDKEEVFESDVVDKMILNDKGLNFLLSNTIEKSLITKECLNRLKQMSPAYKAILDRLEQLTSLPDGIIRAAPHKRIAGDLNMPERQYLHHLYKMRKDLYKLLYGRG